MTFIVGSDKFLLLGPESTLTQETLKMMLVKQSTWKQSSPRRLRPGN